MALGADDEVLKDAVQVTIIRGGGILTRESDKAAEALRSLEEGDFIEIRTSSGALHWGRCIDGQIVLFDPED